VTALFLDSSALARRYLPREPSSSRVKSLCRPAAGTTLLLAGLTPVEIASVFARRVREGRWRVSDRTRAWRVFLIHLRDLYRLIGLSEDVYLLAQELLFRHTLRAADAIQLACALQARAALGEVPLTFVTADRQQARAAQAEGLRVELLA
jgi:predicted nucleic acid-binding protein